MAKVDTKRLFDEYFSSKHGSTEKKIRGQVDRPEIYEYEAKFNKQFVNMNEDELLEMLLNFRGKSNADEGIRITPGTMTSIVCQYRQVFDFYSKNYEPVWNPFRGEKLSISNILPNLCEKSTSVSKDVIDRFILGVRNGLNDQMADYMECVILMFYCGFKSPEEIVLLKEDDIDFQRRVVYLHDREISLSPRCTLLLRRVHEIKSIETNNGMNTSCDAVPYRNGYFKFFVKNPDAISDETPITNFTSQLSRRITSESRKVLGYAINYRNIYMVGFYNHLCDLWGKDKTDEIILSGKNGEYNRMLSAEADKYGIGAGNPTTLKRQLTYYV